VSGRCAYEGGQDQGDVMTTIARPISVRRGPHAGPGGEPSEYDRRDHDHG